MRMWVVVDQFEVLKLEVEDALHLRIDFHLRKCPWLTAKLELHLFQVVQIDMGIPQGMYKVPCLQSGNLGYHL